MQTVLNKFLNGKPFSKKLKLGDLNKETVVAGTQTHERGSVLLLVAQFHALGPEPSLPGHSK